MRFHVLACDYDGTLARNGRIEESTVKALERVRASGRKLLMVTGRELDDLFSVCPYTELFDYIVAENGALLYRPSTKEEKLLAEAPPDALYEALTARGVAPISRGRVILATWEPHQVAALEAIRELSLEVQVIFNKGAVMLLPSGVNKASGLRAALVELGLSVRNSVAIGDAENDHALLTTAECSAVVANAVPSLKERADLVMTQDHGQGVEELIEHLVSTDLRDLPGSFQRQSVIAGMIGDQPVRVPTVGLRILIAGTSGGGKTTLATGILERLALCDYQLCIVDPEGDYESFENATTIGDAHRTPTVIEVTNLLADPTHNVVVNLLGIPLTDRPRYLRELLARLQEFYTNTGRPHWIVLDEAHHMLPSSVSADPLPVTPEQSVMFMTVEPSSVSSTVLEDVDTMMAIGETPTECLTEFAHHIGQAGPGGERHAPLEQGTSLMWKRTGNAAPVLVTVVPPQAERRRHRRKYAEGDLGEDGSFYFRGPDGKLNLRVQNLTLFVQIAEGVGEDVWTYHLRRGEYSRWFREFIKDDELAAEAEEIENRTDLSATESRTAIAAAVHARYTAPVSSI